MQIRDLEGNIKEIADLREAIRQAKLFKDLQHTDKSFEKLDEPLRRYWTDIYEKLLELKSRWPDSGK